MNVTPTARAEHPVLIMNLKSGGGKAEKFRLADECEKRGIEPIVLQPGDDLLQLAEDAIARGADVIGMAGGDGSQALVATVASRRDVPHVCVPAGTRNHFALDLGLDRNDVVGALDAFADAVERRVDLASVNGRVFVNNASLGLYAKVVQSPEYRDAKISTAASILPELLGPEAKPLDLRFRGPDADYPTAHLILVSNDPYQMDHLVDMGTRQRLDLGVLGIVATRIADAAQASRFVAMEAAGAGPPLPRLAGVERPAVRGQLGRSGRDRDRRRGPEHGPAAGLRVAAGRAPGPPAQQRGASIPGAAGAAAVRLHNRAAGPGGRGAIRVMTTPPGPGPLMDAASFSALYQRLRDASAWGPADRRGGLNYLTPEQVLAAAGEVSLGRTVSLAAPIESRAAADNPDPAVHEMTSPAGDQADPDGLSFATDRLAMNIHGNADTHIDALSHVMYRARLYNDVPADTVGAAGASELSIEIARDGIVGRGVLLDIPRLRGVPWLEPGDNVTAGDLIGAADAQQVRIGQGDLLLVRVGHRQRQASSARGTRPGPVPGCIPRRWSRWPSGGSALLGSDSNNDAFPSAAEGVDFPVHVLAINAMGLHLLDWLQLDDLGGLCEEAGRWSFCCVVAPLRLVRGTGSPVNPIAIL